MRQKKTRADLIFPNGITAQVKSQEASGQFKIDLAAANGRRYDDLDFMLVACFNGLKLRIYRPIQTSSTYLQARFASTATQPNISTDWPRANWLQNCVQLDLQWLRDQLLAQKVGRAAVDEARRKMVLAGLPYLPGLPGHAAYHPHGTTNQYKQSMYNDVLASLLWRHCGGEKF